MTKKETRQRIIHAAKTLFAKHGLEGTSVRELAKMADVNLSAVNYHFESKQNLFIETMHSGCIEMQERIEEVYNCYLEKVDDVKFEDFFVHIFDAFLKDKFEIVQSYRLFMTDHHIEDFDCVFKNEEDLEIGPPGGIFIYKIIEKDLEGKVEINRDEIIWCIQSIFTQIIHRVILLNSSFSKSKQMHTKHLTIPESKKSIRKLALVLKDHLLNPIH